MGMEISGRKPTAGEGRLLRMEFWAWRPIHALVGKLCADLVDVPTLQKMALGGGTGPGDQQTCSEMATRFEQWMQQHGGGYVLESGIRVTPEGRFLSEEDLARDPS